MAVSELLYQDFGAARISGTDGSMVYNVGGIAACARTGPGVYLVALNPGTSDVESLVDISVLSPATAPAYEYAWEFLDNNTVKVQVMALGTPADADFTIEITQVRTGPLPGGGSPPPSPPYPANVRPRHAQMDPVTPPAPGALTAPVGFTIDDSAGVPVALASLMEFAVFDDHNLASPSATGTLNNASDGTIAGGAGTAGSKVLTSAAGHFSCTLTVSSPGTYYLGCSESFGSPDVDCSNIASVTFVSA